MKWLEKRKKEISIHALREEGDAQLTGNNVQAMQFLSTPSARRATAFHHGFYAYLGISIHALREEGDRTVSQAVTSKANFYPRPPRGGRPRAYKAVPTRQRFLSTPSARRATYRGAES